MLRAYTRYVSQVRRRSQRRRTAPGRWTTDGGLDEGTGLGLLRAARNDGAPGRGQDGGQTPQPPSKPPSLISDI
ncbi:MAG: hypothetical protein LBM98_13300 [Oscillospiraceae bacterium]|nr:hypothetical protein [Oscillospiraceae bacterium]